MYSHCWLAPAVDHCRLARINREETRLLSHVGWTKVLDGPNSSQSNPSFAAPFFVFFQIGSVFLALYFGLDRALFWPILTEALKMVSRESIPPNLCEATEAKPMDAMHPQDAQSGFPPNWHGVILVF